MTKVEFFKKNNRFIKLEVSGHTDFAEHGKDILCAAISSIVQAGSIGLSRVLNIKIKTKINDSKGYFLIELPQNITDNELELSQIIFETMFESLLELESGYSKHIKLEVK